MSVSRRDVMKAGGALFLGLLGAGSVAKPKDLLGAGEAQQPSALDLPWPYKKLNPEAAAETGYYGYYAGACCFGAFESIIGELRKEVGHPYTMIPTTMMVFGEGGVAGVGTLCGALNGAAAAIFLVTGGMDKKLREPAFAITRELYTWYEQEALPDYKPKAPRFEIAKSVSRSTLCHASVSTVVQGIQVQVFLEPEVRTVRMADGLRGQAYGRAVEQLCAGSVQARPCAVG